MILKQLGNGKYVCAVRNYVGKKIGRISKSKRNACRDWWIARYNDRGSVYIPTGQHLYLPSHWAGKRIRLVVEEVKDGEVCDTEKKREEER